MSRTPRTSVSHEWRVFFACWRAKARAVSSGEKYAKRLRRRLRGRGGAGDDSDGTKGGEVARSLPLTRLPGRLPKCAQSLKGVSGDVIILEEAAYCDPGLVSEV